MILLNFSHPLTEGQIAQVEALSAQRVERLLAVPVQFDNAQPYLPQLQALLKQLPLTAEQWQTLPLLIILPALNFITALLLAELHGRMGYFPAVVRLRPVPSSIPPVFEVAEILNLQAVREAARTTRQEANP